MEVNTYTVRSGMAVSYTGGCSRGPERWQRSTRYGKAAWYRKEKRRKKSRKNHGEGAAAVRGRHKAVGWWIALIGKRFARILGFGGAVVGAGFSLILTYCK
jgi:hypothetical protein